MQGIYLKGVFQKGQESSCIKGGDITAASRAKSVSWLLAQECQELHST